MVENEIVAEPFEASRFAESLTRASRGEPEELADQVKYLARYCRQLKVKTVVREAHYVDRHFLDEYGLYYSRNLDPPKSHVVRFHVFRSAISNARLTELFEQAAATKDATQLCGSLSQDYCGFISIRPLASTPVGRTVLRPLDDKDDRHILATVRYDVHIANLRLEVEGIAFQQQDVAVGACATAALWSALSRVTRYEGMRAPTPAEVSTAAARYSVPIGRTLPAISGLNVPQFCDAVRAVGFAPEVVRADLEPETFVSAVHTYLMSGIPVVLFLTHPDGDHAVAAVGFRLGDRDPGLEGTFKGRSARLRKLYVHDDRLGPYARATLRLHPGTAEFRETLFLDIEDDGDDEDQSSLEAQSDAAPSSGMSAEEQPDAIGPRQSVEHSDAGADPTLQFVVDCAVVPVYPKLRLPARYLIKLAHLMARYVEPLVEALLGPRAPLALNAEFFYQRAGSYLRSLGGRVSPGVDPFLRRIALSRWCAVVRWFHDDEALFEFVYDTTDILRDDRRFGAELLRAIVCLDPRFKRDIDQLAAALGVLSA